MCCESSTLTPLLRQFIWMFEFQWNLQYTFIIIWYHLYNFTTCFYKLIMLRGWTLFSKRSQASLVTETMRAQRDGHMPLPAPRGLAHVRGLTPSESSWVGIVIQRKGMIEIDWTWNIMKHDETWWNHVKPKKNLWLAERHTTKTHRFFQPQKRAWVTLTSSRRSCWHPATQSQTWPGATKLLHYWKAIDDDSFGGFIHTQFWRV